jgi:multiple antibiotic resistance protein
MRELLSFSLLSLSAIFFVVDPMGVIPIFIAITRDDSEEKKADMAFRANVAAFAILTTFAIAGTFVFRILGVTLGAFKVAGGILLLITAIEMLRATQARTRTTPEEENEGAAKEVYAIPVILSIAATCVASYAMLRAAGRIARVLGVTGLSVMNRVIGLVIGAIAVQFIFDGLRDTFPKVLG